jgi:molecular chaperone GrpE
MANPSARTEPEHVDPAGGAAPPPPAGDVADAPEARTPEAARESAVDERLLRAMADLDNLRKRFSRDVARERDAERSRVAGEWLPVVDDLDRALEHLTQGVVGENIADGLAAVRDHAVAVLERLGFPRFEETGDPFDPARHEAVATVEAPVPPGTVVAVVRPGYGRRDEILRPAGVVVARA